ncbi:hypothetical protein PHYSODRAFT_474275 [Phytophthora sojae]|uniref:Uncharacterized protein n=1 Tax=Phytophthora sojae (strain P6497) TaxID=1094619 RepID=G4YE07_PHYSP|nr:hypothetical protein PHYSODRAFT_474275 [Phytophthora sojae]EGZ29025.1 hypothetical protein PHYSODRAFT_474275 [Phytophthora sojae]|eukprot:XP_009516300.1 hypothetical protein PHYSODRAFT_474275 [Phytophthora sojae]
MSFLDRFQGKIATVTAQGHLKKADGSEEIRVGAPKRRSQPQQHEKQPQQRPTGNNNMNHDSNTSQTMLRQPTKVQNAPTQNSPKECRSPREINESRVITDQDQLAFSRKARPVQYEPCKLSQYKKEKPDGYYELGKLQPDLNTDELVEKRAKNERIKAFSQNLRVINKNAQAKKPTESGNEQKATAKAKSTREKGLAFAKRVPKPRLSQRSDSAEGDLPTASLGTARTQAQIPTARNPNTVIDDDSDDDELSAELQQLQQRHEASRAEVEALVGSV